MAILFLLFAAFALASRMRSPAVSFRPPGPTAVTSSSAGTAASSAASGACQLAFSIFLVKETIQKSTSAGSEWLCTCSFSFSLSFSSAVDSRNGGAPVSSI